MFSLEEAARELSSFGLTGSQARAYIALVKLGVAPVSKIARLSKIRREEIYRMMPKLEQLGLVEKILGRPMKYKSVPLKDVLSILFKRERETAKRKIAELGEKRRRLPKQLKSLRVKKRVEEEGSPHFVLILDREQAIRKIVTMIQKAKKRIAIATSKYGAQLGYAYGDVFRKAVRKGVKARIILEIDELDESLNKILREAELFKDTVEMRHIDHLISDMIIVDNTEVMIGTFTRPTAERHVDLWTNNSAYVDSIKWAFDRVWKESVDIKSRIEYLQTGKPIEKTLVFKDPKEAKEKIVELVRSAKKEIFATVVSRRIPAILTNYPLKELRESGVTIRLLVPITKENVSESKKLFKYCKLKHIDKTSILRIIIVDRKHAFGLRPPPPNISSDPEYKEHLKGTMYTNDQRHVDGMMALAEQLWNMGVDGRKRITELETGKPIERTEVIKGRDKIYERLSAGHSKIHSNLFMMGDATLVKLFKRAFMSSSLELKNRGVRVRLLTNINEDNLEVAEELAKNFAVRHRDRIYMRAVLGDEEIGFSWITTKAMPEEGIYSNNPEIVRMLWEMAEDAWDNAVDAQSRIDEIIEGKPIGRVSKPVIEYISKNQRIRK